ncbi:MAG: MCE family protein [Syntrophaceae bacterium]|nr:MCE family protein [Syntrophaceae bacterium]
MSRELKVGLFIASTTVIIIVSLLYLAYEKDIFSRTYTYTLSSRSGDGLTEGMPVVFSGFNIGKVSSLELDDKGMVLIKIKITERHVKWVKSDSEFILYRPLIGAPRIDVITRNLNSPPLSEESVVAMGSVNDINDAIARVQPLLDRITKIADHWEHLSSNLADPRGDLNRILGNAQKITATLSTRKSFLEMAIADKESVEAIHEALKKIKDIAIKIDKMADETDQQIFDKEGTLPRLNIILKDIAGKLKKLDETVDNINKISKDTSDGVKDFRMLRSDIDDAVNAIDDVARKIDALISSKKEPEFKLP